MNPLRSSTSSTSTSAQATSESRDRLVPLEDDGIISERTALHCMAQRENDGTVLQNAVHTSYQSVATVSNVTAFQEAQQHSSPTATICREINKSCSGYISKHQRFALMLSGLLCSIFVCWILLFLSNHHYQNSLRLGTDRDYSSTEPSPPVEFYDYIVVGGGPSGIIVAVELARAFEADNITVLLLEAGTNSQTSVLTNLQQHKIQQQQKQSNLSARSKHTQQRQSLLFPFGRNTLNEFDVPLLWSGVASAQGRPIGQAVLETESPNQMMEDVPHHWAVGRTLLGKAIGGSGLHNAMIYVRSLVTDWQDYNVTGWDFDKHILPSYVQLEQVPFDIGISNQNHTDRGTDGPVTTVSAQHVGAMDAVAPLFVKAAAEAGVPTVASFNDVEPSGRQGAGYYEFNIKRGVRDSVARAFLGQQGNSVRSKDTLPMNLHVRSGVTVTRVLLERPSGKESRQYKSGSGRREAKEACAIGVEYVQTAQFGTTENFHARVGQFLLTRNKNKDALGQVILTAGAILTPQLLSNSGIRDFSRMSKIASTTDKGKEDSSVQSQQGQTPTVHLPGVGKNLQDHPVVTMGFEIDAQTALAGSSSSIYTIGTEIDDYVWSATELDRLSKLGNENQTTSSSSSSFSDRAVENLLQQLGTMGTSGFSAGAFLRSPGATDTSPDIQLTVFPRHMEPHVTRETQQNNRSWLKLLRTKAMLVTVALLKPEARYHVFPSASSAPLVSFEPPQERCLLADESLSKEEKERLKRVMSYRLPEIKLPVGQERYLTPHDVDRLAWGMDQVRKIIGTAPLSDHAGPEIYPGSHVKGEDLRGYIRDKSLANSHWAGSTRMSSDPNDDLAVVDERLSVRRIEGLRIADAGVLPKVPNGNIHSTVCVVANRAAEFIIHDRHDTIHTGRAR